jgi:Domain of unknown function (DUF4440)
MRPVEQIGALLLLGCLPALGPARASGQNPSSAGSPAGTQQSAGQRRTEPPPSQAPFQQGKDDPAETRALRQVEENYLRAEMEDNAQLAATLIADDYIGIVGDGRTSDKQTVLDRLNQHMRSHQPYLITAVNMEEHVFGDTACITYTKIYTQPTGTATYSENVLHILIKRNGTWRLQVSSPIPSPKP